MARDFFITYILNQDGILMAVILYFRSSFHNNWENFKALASKIFFFFIYLLGKYGCKKIVWVTLTTLMKNIV